MARNQTASQTIVVVAMGLVAGACAVALHRHAGLPGPVAATAALSAYLLLLTVHAFAWRRSRSNLEPATRATRDPRQVALQRRPSDAAPKQTPNMPPNRAPAAGPMPPQGPHAHAPLPPAPKAPPQPAGHGQSPQGQSYQAQVPSPHIPSPQGVRPGQPPFSASAPEIKARAPLPPAQGKAQGAQGQASGLPPAPRSVPPPLPGGPLPARNGAAQAPMPDDLQDIWSFRPATAGQKLPPFVTGRVSGASAEPKLPDPAAMPPSARPAPPSAPRQADVEVIQDAIKRLLEEVNAAEQTRNQPQAAAALGAAVPPPLPPQPAGARSSSEASIERSIEALRMTAGAMRSAVGTEAPPAPPAAAPQPPPAPQYARSGPAHPRPASAADARARLMADAISAGRIDVALEPILGLEDHQTRHYEVSVRLRDADGNPLELTPDGPDLRGTGLLPLFDGVRVVRTAAVARRLEDRGKGGAVFSAFSGESVADEHFLGELAETLHLRASLASQLVLSFTQTDVRGFSTPEWDSLADMRALGFRFAITHMTDLDMDFEALAEQGFVFVKLDATVFLSGLNAPSGHIPSADVCRHLAGHGLTLVVERIDDDEQLARVFGFGVLLGQGQLFGGARPVRADVANDRSRSSTVAA